jgi:hypothetical protein
LDWLPSAQASAGKRNYESGVPTILAGLIHPGIRMGGDA